MHLTYLGHGSEPFLNISLDHIQMRLELSKDNNTLDRASVNNIFNIANIPFLCLCAISVKVVPASLDVQKTSYTR